MILYFTGTGNSYDVATRIGQALGDEVVSINALLKSGNSNKLVSSKPFIFVCPTYASRIPNVVRDFVLNHTFEGPKQVYFVITYGGFAGPVGHYVKALVKQKGWVLQGFDKVMMPENYIVMFPNPSPRSVAKTLVKAYKKLDKVIAEIKSGSHFYHSGHVGYLFTKVENKGFYRYAVSGKAFVVNPDFCIKCGTCVKVCPMNNIALNEKGPVWGDKCCGCLGCLHNCPKKAINYQKKTVKKGRYVNPNYRVK
jgi:NAD-dependent dihydropyrimidine dehydrogenase PreA subunit/flavodoxin